MIILQHARTAVLDLATFASGGPGPALFTFLCLLLLVVFAVQFIGLSSRGKALRPVRGELQPGRVLRPAEKIPLHKRWYIESKPEETSNERGKSHVHSCSFVEFDERGDYLNFDQHQQAYLTIQQLARTGVPLTVVIYVHGWRHHGQSNDVLAFNEFLHQLSIPTKGRDARRVHGVYLAWRGASLRSWIPKTEAGSRTATYFGGSIIDLSSKARWGMLNYALETVGYFSRKSVPEHKFAATALARTVFSCGYAARQNSTKPQIHLMGHSFGSLMLERVFKNAAIGQLSEKWPFSNEHAEVAEVNPLPFDTILLVNSAAPSLYAKQFQSYLAGHRQAMVRAAAKHADTPFMFSLTSEGDWATGWAHRIANVGTFFVPTLRRKYYGREFILIKGGPQDAMKIRQSYYYRRTPGHNPLLVNRFIELAADGEQDPATTFTTTHAGNRQSRWKIAFPPTTKSFKSFSTYRGFRPLAWTEEKSRLPFKDTAYWIIRCPKAIIGGHNDIWSQAAMDTYAELHRIALPAKAEYAPSPLLFSAAPPVTVPVRGTSERVPIQRIFCVGRNYEAHAREMGVAVDRDAPFYFTKSSQHYTPSGSTVAYPPGTSDYHHEIELVAVIGRAAHRVPVSAALDCVIGYACGLDMTRRDLQFAAREQKRPWDLGKDVEQSAVLTDIVLAKDIGHPSTGQIELRVNGQTRQQSDLSLLIHGVPQVVAHLSTFYHLEPGDLIYTGTPEGVGPVKPGDRLAGSIAGVGTITLNIGAPA